MIDRPVLIEARGVSRLADGRPILDRADLVVKAGELLAVVGPNGAGKTTQLRLLAGLLSPDRGTVLWLGKSPRSFSRSARGALIGYLPQAEEMEPGLTVRELVGLGRTPHLGPFGGLGPADHAAVAEALARCGLTDLAGRRVGTLSGGERKRAALAMALAQQTRVLLLDEPTAGLDLKRQAEFWRLVRGLREEGEVALVVTTHDLDAALGLADRVAALGEGRVVYDGPPGGLADPATLSRLFGVPLTVLANDGQPPVVRLAWP